MNGPSVLKHQDEGPFPAYYVEEYVLVGVGQRIVFEARGVEEWLRVARHVRTAEHHRQRGVLEVQEAARALQPSGVLLSVRTYHRIKAHDLCAPHDLRRQFAVRDSLLQRLPVDLEVECAECVEEGQGKQYKNNPGQNPG